MYFLELKIKGSELKLKADCNKVRDLHLTSGYACLKEGRHTWLDSGVTSSEGLGGKILGCFILMRSPGKTASYTLITETIFCLSPVRYFCFGIQQDTRIAAEIINCCSFHWSWSNYAFNNNYYRHWWKIIT